MSKQQKNKKRKERVQRSVKSGRLFAGKKALPGKQSFKQIDTFFEQAVALQRSENYSEAEKAYLAILEMHPGHVPSMIQMARLALREYRLSLAFQYAREAVRLNHASPQAHQVLGEVLAKGGLADHAESELTIALQLDNQNCHIMNSLGHVYAQQGRFKEGHELFRQAIAIQPENITSYYNLANNKRFNRQDEDYKLITNVANFLETTSKKNQVWIHFTLAKVFHDCGEYDKAFEEYQLGNNLEAQEIGFEMKSREEMADKIISSQDKLWMEQHSGQGSSSVGPIFIVGMPRSGTTLLETLLCHHPQISGIGEAMYIFNLATSCSDRFQKKQRFPDVLSELTAEEYRELGDIYIKNSREFGVNTTHTIDKMPMNFLYLGFILAILPNAKVLHSTRDPMDTCLSIYQQLFGAIPYSFDLKQIGQYYLLYRRVMEHWKQIFPEKILDVQYEDVVNDNEQQLRRVIEFCGLPWDNCCLEEGEKQHVSHTASRWQARQPIYKTSVKRWKKYEKHLGPLLNVLEPIIG